MVDESFVPATQPSSVLYCRLFDFRRSLEGHFLGQMEAANSFDKYNKAKGEHNSRISRSAMNF